MLQQELDNRFPSIPTSKMQRCQQKLRKDKQKITINKTPRWREGIYGRPILHQLCHTAQSHSSKQVLERKLQGHELETVLLTNFLIERLMYHDWDSLKQSSDLERFLTIVQDASAEFLRLELACTTFITHNT